MKEERERKLIDNYLMTRIRQNLDGTIIYQCAYEFRRSSTCRAQVVKNGTIIKYTRLHDHLPDLDKNKAVLVQREHRKLAKTTQKKPQEIILEIRRQNSGNVNRLAGSHASLRQKIYYARKGITDDYKLANRPPYPISGKAAQTYDGKRFLLDDQVLNGKRMVLLASDQDLQILQKAEVLTVDGTFRVAPEPFVQLLTVMAEISQGVHVPCFYALLESKEQVEYERVLQRISKEMNGCYPETIITDLEMGLCNAVQKMFPLSRYQYCFFHLTHAWRSKINESPILSRECQPGMLLFNFWLRLKTLAFFDPTMISSAYTLIKADNNNIQIADLTKFYAYLEDYYIFGKQGQAPRYDPALWSCVVSVNNDNPRASNYIESWHRGMNGCLYSDGYENKASLSILLKKLAMESFDALKVKEIVDSSAAPPKVKEKQKSQNLLKDIKLKQIITSRPVPLVAPTLAEIDAISDVLRML